MPKDYARIYGSGGNTSQGVVSTLHLNLEEQLILDMALSTFQEDIEDAFERGKASRTLSKRGLATLGTLIVKIKTLINQSDHASSV